jgi:hypothetical protein
MKSDFHERKQYGSTFLFITPRYQKEDSCTQNNIIQHYFACVQNSQL